MRAILQYTNCGQDGKNVYKELAANGIDILNVKEFPFSINPQITILIQNRPQLNELIYKLNHCCTYEVRLVKKQKGKRCDFCKQRDCCTAIKKIFNIFCDFRLANI